MSTKENEGKYISNLTAKEKKWVYSKPFGDYSFNESFLRIRDFSYIIELLVLREGKKYSLLDLGCGPGWTSIMLSKLGISVTGVDISKDMIDIAKSRAKKEGVKINFVISDIEKISFENRFDRVLSYDALHHCPDELEVLKNAFRALKPGGRILLVEPNKKHAYDAKAQAAAKRFGILEKGYSPSYLKKEMTKIGFKNITRYHCNYGLNKPMGPDLRSFISKLVRIILGRTFFSYYASQVWLSATK